MTKLTLCLVLSLLSLTSHAGISNKQCDVDLAEHVQLTNHQLSFQHEQQLISISANGELLIDGKAHQTNLEERQKLKDYFQGYHQLVPEALAIAANGLSVAADAIESSLVPILGNNSQTVAILREQIAALKSKLQGYDLKTHPDITIDSRVVAQDGELELALNQGIEQVMQTAMGELMLKLGKQMLFAGETSVQGLEQQIEQITQQLEQDIEQASSRLEMQAAALCQQLIELDKSESALNQIPALKTLNNISVAKTA